VEIIQFLSKYHGKVISPRTLHRRLREYGLIRRTPRYDIDEIEEEERELLDGPECLVGYISSITAMFEKYSNGKVAFNTKPAATKRDIQGISLDLLQEREIA